MRKYQKKYLFICSFTGQNIEGRNGENFPAKQFALHIDRGFVTANRPWFSGLEENKQQGQGKHYAKRSINKGAK